MLLLAEKSYSYAEASSSGSSAAVVFVILSIVFYLVLIAGGIVLNVFISKWFRNIAQMKGHNEKRYFWVPFFFGLVGYLMVIALPDRGACKDAAPANVPNVPPYGQRSNAAWQPAPPSRPAAPQNGFTAPPAAPAQNQEYINTLE